ncbi:Glutaconyl-CoA decarboxylase subunit beta [bioreactor metagenome]|uniref:Glutaconyl-CoA decarboxylase subunit beta n=1 Tax=bioreactor metagenome TaxID=1076179 RepID=A0A644X035_9ZZZZ
MNLIMSLFKGIAQSTGIAGMVDFRQIIMILLSCVLLYLGIAKKFEPLLLVGIAFGMLLTNLPGADLYHASLWSGSAETSFSEVLHSGGLLDILYIGVKVGLYPSLIFLGIGAMTDFGPIIANPSSLFLGAAAQGGIYCAFALAILLGFEGNVAASIGIIGGADGPTAIWLTKILAPEYLGPIAIAAYSYMALIPLIQPPIMRALTTEKERGIVMGQLRTVSKREKIVFPIMVTIITVLILPPVAPLLGCLMLGNLLHECGVTERLSDTAQNNLLNIVTIFLSISVGATAVYDKFLSLDTIKIIVLGLFAFATATVCGILFGKLMCVLTHGKINPLIGSAGVSAVPMAARVSQREGQRANPSNFLLMHAMGPNVAGVIGSAVAAGCLLRLFG